MTDLRDLLAAATPGPWKVDWADKSAGWSTITAPETRRGTSMDERTIVHGGQDSWGVQLGVEEEADAALIAALVNAAPYLLDVVDAARDVLNPPWLWNTSDEEAAWEKWKVALAALDTHLGEAKP